MCIAILKPQDKVIDKETLRICSENNPDGCGFACIEDGIIYIKKFMDFESFYKEYSKVETKSTMLIHFRIATHGKVEIKNCHPFKLNNRMALIHNGIISGYGDKETKTDTQDFIDKVIGNISWKMWKNPSFIELVNKAIGYSKLCILDVTGNYYIVGEEKGLWVDGVWYSNSSYKKKEQTLTFPKKETKKDNNQLGLWDMYGNESYDDWYSRYYNTYVEPDVDKLVYRCKDCGKIFYENDDVEAQCDVCKSTNVDEIGFKFGKEEYLYSQMGVEV